MTKAGNKTRDLSFMSAKNGRTMTVHTEQAMQYAMRLESDPAVSSYVTNHPLEQDKIEPEQGVRKQYYETQWTTDFVVMFTDGTMGVRELVTKNKLSQRSEIEKLQLSQSYWQKITAGWKIVITQ
jgi:hypothetical protein